MSTTTTENVFLFVPNLIGYGRIITAFISFYFMPRNHIAAFVFYFISGALDMVDGYAARYLNQTSRLGAMLDQLTDRCSTLALLFCLATFYPRWLIVWQIVAIVDIASHWLHLHAADLKGAHYKKVSKETNPVLALYYTSRPFLAFMCAGNDGFFAFLYLSHFTTGPLLPIFKIGVYPLMASLCFPVMLVKLGISLVHLVQAANDVVSVDVRDRQKKE